MWGFYIVVVVLFLIDLYVLKGINLLLKSSSSSLTWSVRTIYWLVNIVIFYQLLVIFADFQQIRIDRPDFVRFWSSIFFVLLVTKFSFLLFHLADDIFWGGKYLMNKTFSSSQDATNGISRAKFLTQLGLGISALLFTSFTYGVVKGRYAFKVWKEKINFDNLPQAFSGLKIVQISDLHLGSFVEDFDEIKKAIELINEQKPDLIFFTGDMVNVHSDEAEPWIEIFSKLEASMGMYSVFGNHDYCDYGKYTPEEKLKSINRLKEIHKEMGFKLLEDENIYLEKDNEKLAIVGMHNWGKDFHRIGSLEKSLEGLKEEDFKILLSHDPSLWEDKILNKKEIELTLSGHTHGMQLGVEIPFINIKFSPVKFRYKRWGGLYKEAKNYIYVNRGFGYLGFPGRVGMNPEITVLELFSKKV